MSASTTQRTFVQQIPLVILGTGFTGRRIFHHACLGGWKVYVTSRIPNNHLSDISPRHRILFDLERPDTWHSIPIQAHIIWCFPAIPLHLVMKFFETRTYQVGRIIVMGSTSAYHSVDLPVTEHTAIKHHLPRVQAEEYLRTTFGAVILRLAGLYGPGRNVLNWIRKGKIQNTSKWVNLLHVEDAARICLSALEAAPDGSTYIASDGTPRTWAEICSMASSRWKVAIPPYTPTKELGKQLSNQKLLTDLHYALHFPVLYDALDQLEMNSSIS